MPVWYDYIIERPVDIERIRQKYPSAYAEVFDVRYAFLHIDAKDFGRQTIENEADAIVNESTIFGSNILNSDIYKPNIPIEQLIQDEIAFGYQATPKIFGLLDSSNIESIGAFRVRNQPALSLRGQGVVIGIVDTGITWDLDIFRNEDGTTRLLGLWDQTLEQDYTRNNNQSLQDVTNQVGLNETTQSRELDGGFVPLTQTLTYGTFYSLAQINDALLSDDPYNQIPSRDAIGHGTALAGIAAGKPDAAFDFSGVAPDASLAVVKLRPAKRELQQFYGIAGREGTSPFLSPAYSEIDIMNGVQYLTELAFQYKRPLVILLGLGCNFGGHDGRMPLAEYLSRVGDASGYGVVAAAGNEGNAAGHYYGVTMPGQTETIEIKVDAGVKAFSLELWGNALNTYRIGLQSPTGRRIEPVSLVGSEVFSYSFPLDASAVYVHGQTRIAQGNDAVAVFHFEAPSEGVWQILLQVEGSFATDFHMWLPLSDQVYFLSPNPYTTVVSNACGTNILTVGMMNHRTNSVVAESSKGYTRVGAIKPDLLAPGVEVQVPLPDGTYVSRTGSSIAAAHGAGAMALLMEYGILRGRATDLDGVAAGNLLIQGADRKLQLTYPNRDWGYGSLDVYNSFLYLDV